MKRKNCKDKKSINFNSIPDKKLSQWKNNFSNNHSENLPIKVHKQRDFSIKNNKNKNKRIKNFKIFIDHHKLKAETAKGVLIHEMILI